MQFTIKVNGLKGLTETLSPAVMQRAISKTLNDLSKAVRTQTAKQIRTEYNITSERIKQGIRVTKHAKPTSLVAELTFGEKAPGLQHYKMIVKPETKKRKYKVISVIVKKGKGRKIVRKAFLIPDKIGIFAVGEYKEGRFVYAKGRKPVTRLLGPTIKGMFRATGGYKIANSVIQERMNKVFDRHLKNEIYRARGKRG